MSPEENSRLIEFRRALQREAIQHEMQRKQSEKITAAVEAHSMDVDEIRERHDARIIDEMYAEPEIPALSEFLSLMPVEDFASDIGDMFLCYMNVKDGEFQEQMVEAAEHWEDWNGEFTDSFKASAARIVHAMLSSAKNYQEQSV